MKKLVLTIALVATACSSSPNRIQSAYVSPTKYRDFTCDDIDREIANIDGHAQKLHKRLRKRADTDAFQMSAGLLLVWPALLFLSGGDGPEAAQYADLKGNRDALLNARQSCARASQVTTANDIPGTRRISATVQLIPAATPSGYCIMAPRDYRGSGSVSRPAITDGTPRCPQ